MCRILALCPFPPFLHPLLFLFWPRAEPLNFCGEGAALAALLFGACVCGACESTRCGPTSRRAARSCGRNPAEVPGAREELARLAEVERSEPRIHGCSLGQAPMTHRLRRSHGQRDQNKVSVF